MRFTDKVAIITGAGSGIGRATARQIHEEGGTVALVDIDRAGVEALAAELGERSAAFVLDLRDRAAVADFAEEAVARFGRVDTLVSNAGVGDQFTAALDTSDELWDRVMGANLVGPFVLTRSLLPALIADGGGSIVYTGSVASIVAGAGGAAYTVSKHGILGLARSVAQDYGHAGVRANAVLPGAVLTGLTADPSGVVEGADDALAGTPAGRWAQPEEVAKVAVLLASDDASFVTGAAYTVDGGWSLA